MEGRTHTQTPAEPPQRATLVPVSTFSDQGPDTDSDTEQGLTARLRDFVDAHDIEWARTVVDDLEGTIGCPVLPGTPLDVALTWQVGRLTANALAPLTRAVRTAARAALCP